MQNLFKSAKYFLKHYAFKVQYPSAYIFTFAIIIRYCLIWSIVMFCSSSMPAERKKSVNMEERETGSVSNKDRDGDRQVAASREKSKDESKMSGKKDGGKTADDKKRRAEEEKRKKEEKERKKKEEEKQRAEEEQRKKEEEEKRQQEEQEKKLLEEEAKRQKEEEAAQLK